MKTGWKKFKELIPVLSSSHLSFKTRGSVYSSCMWSRAREIIGFAGSGLIFETENQFISRHEAKKSVHKSVFLKILQYTD